MKSHLEGGWSRQVYDLGIEARGLLERRARPLFATARGTSRKRCEAMCARYLPTAWLGREAGDGHDPRHRASRVSRSGSAGCEVVKQEEYAFLLPHVARMRRLPKFGPPPHARGRGARRAVLGGADAFRLTRAGEVK